MIRACMQSRRQHSERRDSSEEVHLPQPAEPSVVRLAEERPKVTSHHPQSGQRLRKLMDQSESTGCMSLSLRGRDSLPGKS